jgi:pimeloyl-ACP methyl ester carboxylesterase
MLSYTRRGGGIPIVFVHAFPLSRLMWEGEIAFFEKNFQPLSVDMPGYGDSFSPKTKISMAEMAEALNSLLSEIFSDEKVILCGLSMGGYVLFEFMRKYGDRSRALILAATRAAADSPKARDNRFKMIEQVEVKGRAAAAEMMLPKLLGKTTQQNRPDLVEKVRSLIMKNKSEGIIAAQRGMADRLDSTELLPHIKCPVLVIAGEEDAAIPLEEMKAMKEKIPLSRFEAIPKAGHLVNLEQPEAFDKAVINFLKAKVL